MSRFEWDIRTADSVRELDILLKKYSESLDVYDWLWVLKNQHFTDKNYTIYEKHIPWDSVLLLRKVPISIVEKHFDDMDPYEISAFQSMTVEFLKKHQHQLSLDVVLTNDSLTKDARECAETLFKKNNNPSHHKLWDRNLANNRVFCPKVFRPKYHDYNESTPFPTNVKTEIKVEKIEQQKIIKEKTPKVVKMDYSTMSKAEMKQILKERNVRVYYHDTLAILRDKCKESEGK